MKYRNALLSLLPVFLVSTVVFGDAVPQVLWYTSPATNWEKQALPVGNGRLGGMIFGGVEEEHIQFNEDSLWIGDEKDTGSYQAFGDIFVETGHQDADNYRRELDIRCGVYTVTYQCGDVTYTRKCFSSYPAQVMVLRLTADKKASYSGKVRLTDAHKAKISVEKNTITAAGDLAGYVYSGGSTAGRKNPYGIVLD